LFQSVDSFQYVIYSQLNSLDHNYELFIDVKLQNIVDYWHASYSSFLAGEKKKDERTKKKHASQRRAQFGK
jgi:hypothetical protein